MKEKLQTVKSAVEEVMTQDRRARDNDIWLILQVLRKLGFKIYLDYYELKKMPNFESITRSRRYFQNTEKRLLPGFPAWEVRNLNQENYKEVFGR